MRERLALLAGKRKLETAEVDFHYSPLRKKLSRGELLLTGSNTFSTRCGTFAGYVPSILSNNLHRGQPVERSVVFSRSFHCSRKKQRVTKILESNVIHRGISALGVVKEGFHQFGQFLDAAQCAGGCQTLHLVDGLDELSRDLSFDVRPDLLVGVELRRVWRQGEELELAVLRRDEVLDQLPVHWIRMVSTIKAHQTAPTIRRLRNSRNTSALTEPSCSMKRNSPRGLTDRNHVQRKATPRHFDYRCLADRRPRRPGVIVERMPDSSAK